MNRKHLLLGLMLVLGLSLAISACAAPTPAATEAPEPTEVETEPPAPEPTEPPAPELGTADNPIVFAFVPSADAATVLASGEAITARLSELTGLTITAEVPTSYTAAIEAMCAGESHVGALATFGYVLASSRGCAEVGLVSVRSGSSVYTGQIITRADSGITSVDQLAGKTFCRQSETSTSGWIMPSILLKEAGVDPDTGLAEVKDTGGHDLTVQAVYDGECDAGATFGDARTLIAEAHPDVNEVVVVIATTADIPNDTVAFTPDVPADIRAKLVQAFKDMAANEADLKLLGDLYRWTGVEEQDDSFFDPFRQFLDSAGVNVEDYLPK